MKKTLLKKDNYKNIATYLVVIVAFVIMQTLSNQGKLGSAVTGYLVPVCCYIVLAVSLNLLVGVCGELSLGHAGFMGVGAFSGVVLATLLKDTVPSPVLRLILAMVFGGLLAGIIGFIIGVPVLRLRGEEWGLGTACEDIATAWDNRAASPGRLSGNRDAGLRRNHEKPDWQYVCGH